jgi:hypothetical protein
MTLPVEQLKGAKELVEKSGRITTLSAPLAEILPAIL